MEHHTDFFSEKDIDLLVQKCEVKKQVTLKTEDLLSLAQMARNNSRLQESVKAVSDRLEEIALDLEVRSANI